MYFYIIIYMHICTNKSTYIYIYKQDLVLNNPQGLICSKTQTNYFIEIMLDCKNY